MLMPALSRARESARQTVCTSNLRQLSIGFTTYLNGNDDWWTVGGPGGQLGAPGVPVWPRVIAKELRLKFVHEQAGFPNWDPDLQKHSYWAASRPNTVFECPSELFKNAWGGENSTSYTYNAGWGTPWGCLGAMDISPTSNPNWVRQYGRVRMGVVKNPSNTFVIGESYNEDGHYDYALSQFAKPFHLSLYHGGGGNLLWADGHAGHMKLGELTFDHFWRTE